MTMHKRSGKGVFNNARYFVLALCFACASCVSNMKYYDFKAGARFPGGSIRISEFEGGCEIYIGPSYGVDGTFPNINENLAAVFEQVANDADKRNCTSRTVLLNTSGGLVSEAMKIGRLIRMRGYDTKLPLSNQCSSSCGLIFIAGVKRTVLTSTAEHNSRAGFHQLASIGPDGKKICIEPTALASQNFYKYAKDMLPARSAAIFHSWAMQTECNSMAEANVDALLSSGIATDSKPFALFSR